MKKRHHLSDLLLLCGAKGICLVYDRKDRHKDPVMVCKVIIGADSDPEEWLRYRMICAIDPFVLYIMPYVDPETGESYQAFYCEEE